MVSETYVQICVKTKCGSGKILYFLTPHHRQVSNVKHHTQQTWHIFWRLPAQSRRVMKFLEIFGTIQKTKRSANRAFSDLHGRSIPFGVLPHLWSYRRRIPVILPPLARFPSGGEAEKMAKATERRGFVNRLGEKCELPLLFHFSSSPPPKGSWSWHFTQSLKNTCTDVPDAEMEGWTYLLPVKRETKFYSNEQE